MPAPVTPRAPAPPPPAVIRDVFLRRVSDTKAQIVIETTRTPEYRAPSMTSDRLTLDLRNVFLPGEVMSALRDARHPLFSGVQIVGEGTAARLIVDLTRVVAYAVSPATRPAAGLILDLALPRGAGGNLAGKLVVVDAGHGAHDSGAKGVNGRYEKNLNLAISHLLRETLQDLGANVLMTRSDDYFVSLAERPRIANRAGADFFVSVHCDSVRNPSTNGSTVYYHKQIGSSRALAQSIAERLRAMGGIATKGIRSDQVLYNSGLAVLRGSQMAAVLVECGYMTNMRDVSLLSQSFMQRRIAQSIADGLRQYVEGNSRQDTRRVNPRPAAEPFATDGPVAVSGRTGAPAAIDQ